MTHTPVFLSLRSSGLRRGAALAILPLLLASCGSSTSTASNTPAPSNTTVASSPSAASSTGSASSSTAKKTSTPCLEPEEATKAETLKQQEAHQRRPRYGTALLCLRAAYCAQPGKLPHPRRS